MNALTQSFQTPLADFFRPSMRRDLLVVGVVTAATYILAGLFELNERLAAWTVPHEAYQLDELPVTILAMSVALAWFSWRRSRQAMEQVTLRLAVQQALVESEEQYRTLFMENLSGNLLATTNGQVKLANPSAARLLGFETADDLIGHQLGEFYAERNLWETIATGCCAAKDRIPDAAARNRDRVAESVAKAERKAVAYHEEPELHVYITDITKSP
jgi:PAS domain S-box-containing protein